MTEATANVSENSFTFEDIVKRPTSLVSWQMEEFTCFAININYDLPVSFTSSVFGAKPVVHYLSTSTIVAAPASPLQRLNMIPRSAGG